MPRNVHKDDSLIIQLPQEAIQEDRGLKTCAVPQLVLASTMDVVSYKNDRTAIAYKFDSMTIELEDRNGVVTPAQGISVSFPHQPDAVGFIIDWRQVTDGGGALVQGCYRVRVNWTLAGNSDWFYYGSYNLLEYSIFNARNTARLYVVLNNLVRKQGINYKDSGFAGTVRFEGIFGFMQPNYDIENNTHTNRERYSVRREALRTYELRTSFLPRCQTRLIDEETLLAANQIYITDHNANNHDQQFYDFPVIIKEGESTTFEYTTGVYAKIVAKFLDKVAYHESKYDGNIAGSENVILQLPTTVASCPSATVTLDSATFLTVGSGSTTDANLVDQNDVTITPISIISGVVKVFQNPPQIFRSTAELLKSGDVGDGNNGRDLDPLTLDSAPIHDNGDPTINTTTNRFTDTLGGQVYLDTIVIDWSTFNGSTVLGYSMPTTETLSPNSAITFAAALSLGTYTSGWGLVNRPELGNLMNDGYNGYISYPPFNITPIGVKVYFSQTTYKPATTLVITMRENALFSVAAKTATATCRLMASREFTVTGLILT